MAMDSSALSHYRVVAAAVDLKTNVVCVL
jgi:hypothetical protein